MVAACGSFGASLRHLVPWPGIKLTGLLHLGVQSLSPRTPEAPGLANVSVWGFLICACVCVSPVGPAELGTLVAAGAVASRPQVLLARAAASAHLSRVHALSSAQDLPENCSRSSSSVSFLYAAFLVLSVNSAIFLASWVECVFLSCDLIPSAVLCGVF